MEHNICEMCSGLRLDWRLLMKWLLEEFIVLVSRNGSLNLKKSNKLMANTRHSTESIKTLIMILGYWDLKYWLWLKERYNIGN